jgi:Caspase domain
MTTDSINTENVYALVVGIEKYKGGSGWDLNGPAKDALKFANWLLDRRVKPEHIQLFLSPLDANAGVLEDAKAKGLNPFPADRYHIDSAIRSKLTSEGNRGDLLHVFWGGHGFITKTGATTRRLFFADTDNISKWNLDFNSLVEALNTFAQGSGFRQQIFWIDACANTHYQGLYETIGAEAAAAQFITNGEQGKAEQFVLFAAAEYEVATNESAEGTGRFSRAVLDELQQKSLLPDMKELAVQIQANFREQQQLEPVYFWTKGRSYEEEEDRLKLKDVVVTQKRQPLSQAQPLKLQYLQTKSDSLKQKVQKVQLQIDAVLPADVLTKDALENRLNLLFDEIEQVDQSIRELGQGNG